MAQTSSFCGRHLARPPPIARRRSRRRPAGSPPPPWPARWLRRRSLRKGCGSGCRTTQVRSGAEAGEKGRASRHRQAAGVPAPLGRVREPGPRRRTGQPDAPPDLRGARVRAGLASTATIRSTSRASPSTASTAARARPARVRPLPGRRWPHGPAARWPPGPRSGRSRARPRRRSSYTSAATSASGLSGRGAGPMPPHFCSTTALTRASRLPRLLARSEL